MRYRPMPSLPRSLHCSTSCGNSMLPSSWIRTPSSVCGRQIAEGFELAGLRALLIDFVAIAGERFFVGMQNHQTLVAVDDHRLAAGDVGQERPGADDGRNAERLGDDRRVAAGAADFGDEAADELRIEIGRFAGREIVGQHEHFGR